MIVQYIRKGKKRIKKGTMVAIPSREENKIYFGYSLCNLKKDKFNKDFGKAIAIDRAVIDNRPLIIPLSIQNVFAKFVDRCKKYYKQIDSDIEDQQKIIFDKKC